ncbi:U2 snRNP-associated SURP motif-containing protein-like protein, partial [Leptotrombidium deliense]
MKAFNITAKKTLSKKELEKQKKLLDEEAAAEVYQEFVESFEKPTASRVFVRGSVIKSGSGEEITTKQLYKPTKLQELEDKMKKKQASTSIFANSSVKNEKPPKKKDTVKKKSNLELFKEELKMIQEEREERHRLKTMMKKDGGITKELSESVKLADDYRLPAL